MSLVLYSGRWQPCLPGDTYVPLIPFEGINEWDGPQRSPPGTTVSDSMAALDALIRRGTSMMFGTRAPPGPLGVIVVGQDWTMGKHGVPWGRFGIAITLQEPEPPRSWSKP